MTQTVKPDELPRVLTFQIKVTVPSGMGDGKARRLLNKMLDVGYADAAASADSDHGLDDGGDAQAAVSLNFDQPRLSKPNEIIVVIEGGCCTAVFARDPNVKVELLDWDNAKDGDAAPAELRAAMKVEKRTERMKAVF